MQPPLLQVGPLHPSPAQGGGERQMRPPHSQAHSAPASRGLGPSNYRGAWGGLWVPGDTVGLGRGADGGSHSIPQSLGTRPWAPSPPSSPGRWVLPQGCAPRTHSITAPQVWTAWRQSSYSMGGGVGGQGWRVEQPGAGDPEASLCRAQRSRMAQGELPGSYIQDEGSGALYQRGGLLGEVNAHHHSCPQADPARTPPFPWGKQRSGDTDGGRAEHWVAPGGSPVLCPQPEVPTPGAPSHCPPPTHRVLLGAAIS